MSFKIVAISDVHNRFHNLVIPECDLLLSAGDYSFHGEIAVVKSFHEWLNEQPAKHIISGQGNHEVAVEKDFARAEQVAKLACPRVHFVEEEEVIIDGIKIWCSPITPNFFGWAWNRARGEEIKSHWDKIPVDTNILMTHGPPYRILDTTNYVDGTIKERVGCQDLLDAVKRIKPRLHVFGHIHTGHGMHEEDGTTFYNVSICDDHYAPTNPVTIINYEQDVL